MAVGHFINYFLPDLGRDSVQILISYFSYLKTCSTNVPIQSNLHGDLDLKFSESWQILVFILGNFITITEHIYIWYCCT